MLLLWIDTEKHVSSKKEDYENDIALLELEEPVEMGMSVNIACLPEPDATPLSVGSMCWALGWGSTSASNAPIMNAIPQNNFPFV